MPARSGRGPRAPTTTAIERRTRSTLATEPEHGTEPERPGTAQPRGSAPATGTPTATSRPRQAGRERPAPTSRPRPWPRQAPHATARTRPTRPRPIDLAAMPKCPKEPRPIDFADMPDGPFAGPTMPPNPSKASGPFGQTADLTSVFAVTNRIYGHEEVSGRRSRSGTVPGPLTPRPLVDMPHHRDRSRPPTGLERWIRHRAVPSAVGDRHRQRPPGPSRVDRPNEGRGHRDGRIRVRRALSRPRAHRGSGHADRNRRRPADPHPPDPAAS